MPADNSSGHVHRELSQPSNPPSAGGPAGTGPRPPEPEIDYRRYAQDLPRELTEREVHPVLIFGTSESGKSVMLQSLLGFAKSRGPGFTPAFGDSVFPSNYPGKAGRDSNALNFFNNMLEALRAGKLAPRTQITEGPFFLPIDIKPPLHRQPLRLAFLESMGEWYQRDGAEGPYKDMRWEVASILETFEKPISVIFVAPTVGVPTHSREYSNLCLANAMAQYNKLRIAKQRDNLLFLASKWDAICNPDDPHANFSDATAMQAVDRVRDWTSWTQFLNIDGLRPGAKVFTPYSAARVNRNGVMTVGGQYAEVFEQYNRTIWNWLYGNMTERPFSTRERPILFEDVVPRPATSISLYQKAAGSLLFLFQREPKDHEFHR